MGLTGKLLKHIFHSFWFPTDTHGQYSALTWSMQADVFSMQISWIWYSSLLYTEYITLTCAVSLHLERKVIIMSDMSGPRQPLFTVAVQIMVFVKTGSRYKHTKLVAYSE